MENISDDHSLKSGLEHKITSMRKECIQIVESIRKKSILELMALNNPSQILFEVLKALIIVALPDKPLEWGTVKKEFICNPREILSKMREASENLVIDSRAQEKIVPILNCQEITLEKIKRYSELGEKVMLWLLKILEISTYTEEAASSDIFQ